MPLFDHKQSKYSENGLDGITFFADGTFSYRNKTFGTNQRIRFKDPETRTTIERDRGRCKMLSIREPVNREVYRFSFHSTIEHPLQRRWYRWSVRPRAGIVDRVRSSIQTGEKNSLLFRGVMSGILAVLAAVIIAVVVCCPLLWPVWAVFGPSKDAS